MSDVQILTQDDPVQITDGSKGAHVTELIGAVLYADAANSAAWHEMSGRVLEIRPPVVIFMKAKAKGGAKIVVTSWSES